jgi:DNA-binding SARP family transcriptional activator/tetratricopeptide (TPR) repeat protein
MQFRLLGDIEIHHGGRVVPLQTKPRLLLAVLLFSPNRVVSRSHLIDLVWGPRVDDHPRTVNGLVTDYVSQLRRAFRDADVNEIQLLAQAGGFVLRVDPQRIDWFQFTSLLERARAASQVGDVGTTAELLRTGLDLWHGRALSDAGKHLAPLRTAMDDRRLEAAELLADIELRRGEAENVLPLLAELGWSHPGRERLTAQLIRALHVTGRRSEATGFYTRSRRYFIDRGLDPSEQIEVAYQAVLRSQPATVPPVGVPAELPPDTSSFTGRSVELARLLALVPTDAPSATVATVCVIHGMAGVGKTALAVHAAHQLASRFPDGQLSLDLQAYKAGAPRIEPAEALDRLLRKLGVEASGIPGHLDDRAARYRERLAGRRMLILLDNAHGADQVRSLIPASGGCLVLVTARSRMAALDDAHLVSLDTLPMADAVALLERIVSGDRLAGQRPEVERIVELCGGLPLAIRIVAARMRSHSTWTPGQVATWLAEWNEDFSELDDGVRSVNAAFSLSIADLGPDQQRMFRLLGLVPGRDIDTDAAAALFGAPLGYAARLLHELFDAHLLDQQIEGRYGQHDLLRRFAAHCAADLEPAADQRAALLRWLAHQVATAAGATTLLFPDDEDRRIAGPAVSRSVFSIATPPLARRWLDAERHNLLAGAARAVELGRPDYAWALDAVLYPYLINGARYADALELHDIALRAARHRGDVAAESVVLGHLGNTHRQRGRYDAALDFLRQALAAQQAAGDHIGQVGTLSDIGAVFGLNGHYDQACAYLEQAVALARQVGVASPEPTTLVRLRTRLGNLNMLLGGYDVALDQYRAALAICDEIGDQGKAGQVLSNLGILHYRLGSYAEAIEHYLRALSIFEDIGDRANQAVVLSNLGEVHAAHGDLDLAAAEHQRALSIFRAIEHRPGEGAALNDLALTCGKRHQSAQAMRLHWSALEIARDIGARYEQARALAGLAELLAADGRQEQAGRYLVAAYELFSELGVPEAQALAARLSGPAPQAD